MSIALLFPGQGSQCVGMGKALFDQFASAREIFHEVDEALSQKLSTLMFEGSSDALTLTENAQPAIMASSMAALKVMQSEAGFNVKQADFVAGHSLGEYSALCAAGALPLTQTARLLKVRGRAMQQSVPAGNGAMAALLGIDRDQAETIAGQAAGDDICTVANDNAPGQVVISGTKIAVERAIELAKEAGAKRAIMLEVSAPFHCPLMAPASGVMAEALSAVDIKTPIVPLVANISAKSVENPEQIKQLLIDQVTGVVRWRESMTYLAKREVTSCIEIGTGKVLAGLNKRISKTLSTISIGEPDDLALLEEVSL